MKRFTSYYNKLVDADCRIKWMKRPVHEKDNVYGWIEYKDRTICLGTHHPRANHALRDESICDTLIHEMLHSADPEMGETQVVKCTMFLKYSLKHNPEIWQEFIKVFGKEL